MKGSSVVPGLPKTRSTPSLWASSISRRAAFTLDGVLARLSLDHRPVDVRELLERRGPAEPAPAALLHTAERHLGLVLHGRVVDMADPALDPLCDVEGRRNVAAEDRAGESVVGVVRGRDRLVDVLVLKDRDDRPE